MRTQLVDGLLADLTKPEYMRKNLTSCSKSANKPSTSCVRTACPKLSTSLEQAVITICNNLVDTIRFVACKVVPTSPIQS